MYTSCPECGTVFRIAPADLRRAAGRVRCGTCDTAFNALESLSDRGPDDPGDPAAVPAAATAAPGEEPEPEALEFDVPPDRWSSFFARPGPDAEGTVNPAPLDAAAGEDWDELLADLHDDEDERPAAVYVIDTPPVEEPDYPAEQLASTVDLPPIRERLYPAPLRPAKPEALAAEPALTSAWTPVAMADTGGRAAGDEDAADGEDFLSDAGDPDIVPPSPFRPQRALRRRRWPWALGSLLLLATLAAQWAHGQRDTLAAHPAWGELVQQAYAQAGLPLYPAWDLQSYRVLGSEAIAGRAAPEALEIVARLQVTGAAPVGLPLLRVIVRDRWGNTVGERLVRPEDYAPERAGSLIVPGTVLPVTVSLRDPGTEAHGYEIDLCLPQREQGLACQLDRPVFRR